MEKRQLGLWTLTTLVAGNMIGSGIFLLPANLASIGSISLLSWIATTIGAFSLAIVFSRMSLFIPKTGGPYVYAEAGFGKFIGFQTAYNYWIAIWVGNAAIALAGVGYLSVFWPVLKLSMPACLAAIASVWLFTFINVLGVRSAGITQLVSTILKFIPLLVVALFGWIHFHPEYLASGFNLTSDSNFTALSNGAALTLWAFIGVESATIPAESTKNPARNIPLATLLGTLIATILYIASSTVIMGMIPAHVLATSVSPFADAAHIIMGQWGDWIVGAGAAISCFGCLNGWTLLQGQIPMAAADDKLFPSLFAKRNNADVPAYGLIMTSVLITILLLLTISPDLVKQFQFIILIAALASLIPYLYTAITDIMFLNKQPGKPSKFQLIMAIIAGTYSFWALFGSGKTTIFYGSMLVFTSVPLYALLHKSSKQESPSIGE